MSTTAKTGKGKKKTKDTTKVPLEEFNSIEVPHGHTLVSIPGLDWAATMAEHDSIKQTDKKIILPQAPRAQRGPNIDPEKLPKDPPYKVILGNLPFNTTEQEIRDRFFKDISVKCVDIEKAEANVELETFQDLYDALCRSGNNLKTKEVSVTLFGQSMGYGNYGGGYGGGYNRSGGYGDRYGAGRQGGERSGFRDRNATGGSGFGGGGGTDETDRTDSDWRSAPRPAPASQPPMYNNDRMGSGQRPQYSSRRSYDPENRNKYEGRSSYPERPGGLNSLYNRDSYSDRGDDRFSRHRMMSERQPERDFANVRTEVRAPIIMNDRNNRNSNYPISNRMDRDSYDAPPTSSDSYSSPHYAPTESVQAQANALGTIDEPRSTTPQSSLHNRPLLDGPNSEPLPRRSDPPRRPVLNLQKRTKPIEPVSEAPTRNPAIFGDTKPVDTAAREREIEEKLKALSVEQQQDQAGSKPGSAPRSRRVSEAVSETSSNTVAKE